MYHTEGLFRPPPGPSECPTSHDVWTLVLSLGLCTGLIISYLPQHIRIISSGTSEGFSPWYLLLGTISSTSGILNLLIMQWPLFRCCRIISAGRCFESLLGFYQVTLQGALFGIIFIMYLVYFPAHLKYQHTQPLETPPPTHYGAVESIHSQMHSSSHQDGIDGNGVAKPEGELTTTPEWRLAITLGVVVALHLGLLLLLTLTLLYVLPPASPPHPLLRSLATFLGLSATLLAICQYAPQIHKTYKAKLVGALSLGTMAIQVPGSVLFVTSLVLRPGTDWTSWLAYALTGAMQGALLIICLFWKRRQKRLGVDDFGYPVNDAGGEEDEQQRLVGDT